MSLSGKRPGFRSWQLMHQRCRNPNSDSYPYYGGKGISVDSAWKYFTDFWQDMGDTWFEGAVIDRIDPKKNYCRENCRWLTRTESPRNQSNVKLTHQKVKLIRALWSAKNPSVLLKDWAKIVAPLFGVKPDTLRHIVRGNRWVNT